MIPKSFGFTGTQQSWAPARQEAIEELFLKMIREGVVIQHNGDCIGSDLAAARTWRSFGGLVYGHPPDVSGKRAFFSFDKTANPKPYMDRNTEIAKCGKFLVATPNEYTEQLRSGTWSTVRRARKMNKTVVFVFPCGKVTVEHNGN